MPSPLSGESLSDAYMRRGQIQAAGIQAQQRPWAQAVQSIGQQTAGTLASAMKERHELPARNLEMMSNLADLEYRRQQTAQLNANSKMKGLTDTINILSTIQGMNETKRRADREIKHDDIDMMNKRTTFWEKFGATMHNTPDVSKETMHNALRREGIDVGVISEDMIGEYGPMHDDNFYANLNNIGQPVKEAFTYEFTKDDTGRLKVTRVAKPFKFGDEVEMDQEPTLYRLELKGEFGEPVPGTQIVYPNGETAIMDAEGYQVENPELWKARTAAGAGMPGGPPVRMMLQEYYDTRTGRNKMAWANPYTMELFELNSPNRRITDADIALTTQQQERQDQMETATFALANLFNVAMTKEHAERMPTVTDSAGNPILFGSDDAIFTSPKAFQLVKNLFGYLGTWIGTAPVYKQFLDFRLGLGGELAVASQGSRPSDADILRIWGPIIPDTWDTGESAFPKMVFMAGWLQSRDIRHQRANEKGRDPNAFSVVQYSQEMVEANNGKGRFFGDISVPSMADTGGKNPDGSPLMAPVVRRWVPTVKDCYDPASCPGGWTSQEKWDANKFDDQEWLGSEANKYQAPEFPVNEKNQRVISGIEEIMEPLENLNLSGGVLGGPPQ